MTGEAQEPVVLKLGAIRRWYGGRTGHYDETGEWVSGKNWNYHHHDYFGLELDIYGLSKASRVRPLCWRVSYSLGRGQWSQGGRCASVAEGLRLALRAFEREMREAWAAAWSDRTRLYQWDWTARRWEHIGHGATWTSDLHQFTGVGTFAVVPPDGRPYYVDRSYGGSACGSGTPCTVDDDREVPALILA